METPTHTAPPVALDRLVRLPNSEKYADPAGPKRMRGCSLERVEEQLLIALDGHPDSDLWGENGLIAATMRAASVAQKLEEDTNVRAICECQLPDVRVGNLSSGLSFVNS